MRRGKDLGCNLSAMILTLRCDRNNLLHIACARGNTKLLQHYLEKLPEDSLERLVQQRNSLRGDGMTVSLASS